MTLLKVTDSTRYAEWFRCPEKRRLYSEEGGTGVVSVEDNIDTTFGTLVHDSVESMLRGQHWREAAEVFLPACLNNSWGITLDGQPRSTEMAWLGVGLIKAFSLKLSQFLSTYKIVHIEQELVMPLGKGVVWCTRPDAILERSDGSHFNCNIKTTGYMADVAKSFEFSVQMFMEARAVRLSLGQDTQGTVIIALNKGNKSGPLKGDRLAGITQGYRRDSPFTYVWFKNGTWSFNWSGGSIKTPTWTFNKSPYEWLDKLPEDVVYSQCEVTDPITQSHMPEESLISDIVNVETMVRYGPWPRNYNNCNNDGQFKRECPYKPWCHGTQQEHEQLFIPRTPNHPVEDTIRGHSDRSQGNSEETW